MGRQKGTGAGRQALDDRKSGRQIINRRSNCSKPNHPTNRGP